MKIDLINWLERNSANILTFLGFTDAIAFLTITICYPELLWLQIFLYLAGGLTDFADGYLARKLKIESLIGSLLDRLRDTVLIYPTLAILVWRHRWNFVDLAIIAKILTIAFVVIIIGLQIFLLGTAAIGIIWFLGGKKIDLSPNKWGKRKIFCGFVIGLIWLVSLAVEKYQGFLLIRFTIWIIIFGMAVLMIPWSYKSLTKYWERGKEPG